MLNEGNALKDRGDARGALTKFTECLAIGRSIKDSRTRQRVEGNALGGLGIVYSSLGQYDKAKASLEAALAISREMGDKQNEGKFLSNLGIVYKALGQYDKAKASYEASLVIYREIGDKQNEASALSGLGNVYRSLGQYVKAKASHEAASPSTARSATSRASRRPDRPRQRLPEPRPV